MSYGIYQLANQLDFTEAMVAPRRQQSPVIRWDTSPKTAMLPSNGRLKRAAAAVLLAFVLVSPASSTVYLLLLTPDAVVIGTDSQSTNEEVSNRGSATRFGQTEKVVSIANGQVLIGTIGLSKIEHNYKVREVIYDFPTWARALKIKPETPIMQVARVVANDSFSVMNNELSQKLRDGTYSPDNAGQNPSQIYLKFPN